MQKFSYTAQRSQFLTIALLFTFLVSIEAGAMFLVSALVLGGTLRLVVELLIGVLHLAMLVFLFGPLFTSHTLTQDRLRLRYSFGFRADLPLTEISSAKPVKENMTGLTARVSYDPAKQETQLAFSPQGQVRLELKEARTMRINYRAVPVKRLLINVDRRDEFLQALALPAANVSAEAVAF